MKNLRSGNGGKNERGSKTLGNVNVLFLVSRCKGGDLAVASGKYLHDTGATRQHHHKK
jgi:hypothetical protein